MRTSLWMAVALAACRGPSHEGHATKEAEPVAVRDVDAGDGGSGVVTIDREMLRDLRLTTARAEARPAGEGVVVLGELKVDEDAYAEVGTPIVARVVRVHAAPGDVVREGQPLVELQSLELGKARAEHLTSRARAELARQALERKRTLVGERIAPARELEEAKAQAAAADADVRAARAALRALGVADSEAGDATFTLRAPLAGTVLERAAARGQMTDPARPLFRIADVSRFWLTAHAFERDALRVKPGGTARVTFAALPGRDFSGTVARIGSQVDTSSRTISIRIDLPNPDGILRPGMSANAWVPLGDDATSLVAVPAASLQRTAEGWSVFVPRDERTFEIRAVGRGRDLGGEVEIVSGLVPGETIVVEGSFLLKAEAEKARGEGEHHPH